MHREHDKPASLQVAEWRSDQNFFVDLHERPGGPARPCEVHLQGGDCTTEIFR